MPLLDVSRFDHARAHDLCRPYEPHGHVSLNTRLADDSRGEMERRRRPIRAAAPHHPRASTIDVEREGGVVIANQLTDLSADVGDRHDGFQRIPPRQPRNRSAQPAAEGTEARGYLRSRSAHMMGHPAFRVGFLMRQHNLDYYNSDYIE